MFTLAKSCKTGKYCEHNLYVLVCGIILQKCISVFLAASLQTSIEHRNICALNFCDPLKILKSAKIKQPQKFPVPQKNRLIVNLASEMKAFYLWAIDAVKKCVFTHVVYHLTQPDSDRQNAEDTPSSSEYHSPSLYRSP